MGVSDADGVKQFSFFAPQRLRPTKELGRSPVNLLSAAQSETWYFYSQIYEVERLAAYG